MPRTATSDEDDGWLLAYVHDENTQLADVEIWESQDFTGDPEAPFYDFEVARDRVAASVEAAAALGVSESTIKRKWRAAKAWLFIEISRLETGRPGPRDRKPEKKMT